MFYVLKCIFTVLCGILMRNKRIIIIASRVKSGDDVRVDQTSRRSRRVRWRSRTCTATAVDWRGSLLWTTAADRSSAMWSRPRTSSRRSGLRYVSPRVISTRISATADGPRDVMCPSKSFDCCAGEGRS